MSRRTLVLSVLVLAVVVGAWFMFLWRPAGDDLAAAEDRAAAARTERDNLQSQLVTLQALEEQRPYLQAELESLRSAVPADDDLADVVLSINEAAAASGVVFTDFSSTPPGAADGFGLSEVTMQLSGSGGYFQLLDFMNRMARIQRILVVDTVSISAASNPEDPFAPPDLNWTVGAKAFVDGSGGAGDEIAPVATESGATAETEVTE